MWGKRQEKGQGNNPRLDDDSSRHLSHMMEWIPSAFQGPQELPHFSISLKGSNRALIFRKVTVALDRE